MGWRANFALDGEGGTYDLGIVAMGLWLIDNCNLEDLAATCERLGRYDFAFSLAPIRFQGVTGSPVNPLAMF